MRFSITTLSLLALFSFVSAEANAIPNADPVAEPNAAPDAEANTNNLWNAINGAAKAKQAAALNLKNFGMFGAIGFPKEQTWRQKCKKKNPKIEHVIAKFCERGTGGKGGVTVPNKYPSGGMCTNIDPKAANHAPDGKGNPHVKKQVQWCTKIGSKKKKCKPFRISKDMCMGKLFQVCAKGDNEGKGKAAENGGCQVYRTGKINYSNNWVGVGRNPFYDGWTAAGFY